MNDGCRIAQKNDHAALVQQDGNLKLIECDYDILSTVLELICEEKGIQDILDLYRGQYTEDEVMSFLTSLCEEGIIYEKTVLDTAEPVNVMLVGSGTIFDYISSLKHDRIRITSSISVHELLNGTRLDGVDTIIFAPAHATYKTFFDVNRRLVDAEVPFIPIYYTGESFCCGPFVFPWKTPCLECVATHHVSALNRSCNEQISIQDIEDIFLSVDAVAGCERKQLEFVIELLLKDVSNVTKRSTNFIFHKKELHFNKKIELGYIERKYHPITDCTCCHGMNKAFSVFKGDITPPEISLPVAEKKIQYHVGGLRSKTEDETKALIESAINQIGADISIDLVEDNIFHSVLPVYDSKLNTSHKNRTPYFLDVGVSHGKGITRQQAYFSAAFELFERMSARYYGTKPIIRATPNEVADHAIDLKSMTAQVSNLRTVYDDLDLNAPVDWVWGKSLITGKERLVPACHVFLTGAAFKGNFVPNGSSGLSAGATLSDAILQGLFEVIEHDAWMIGQANTIALPQIDVTTAKRQSTSKIIEKIKALGFEIYVRDYTTDIGIPVLRTWICDPSNYTKYAFNGFGCSVDAEIALERSITEAVQGFLPDAPSEPHEYGKIHMVDSISSRDSLFSMYYFRKKDMAFETEKVAMKDLPCIHVDSVDDALHQVIQRLQAAMPGCDVLFIDMTRKEFGVPAVKVIVTGDIQRLSEPLITVSRRLYEFPKKMGYADLVLDYKDLYLGPYQH